MGREVNDLDLISSLQDVLREEAAAYSNLRAPYALLDFPNYPNVGDSAIWLGELAHLRSTLNADPAFVCDYEGYSPDALRRAMPDGPIFLSGGGNFGDLWPHHQLFREAVLEQFPDRRIIQLPQSIHFQNPDLIERTANVIKRHGNFMLFVRSHRSLGIARACFDCPVHLAPDMAVCLGAIARPAPPVHELLLLLRDDKERARPDFGGGLPEGAIVTDWLEEDPEVYKKVRRRTALTGLFKHGVAALSRRHFTRLLFQDLAQNRVDRGVKLLSSAKYVITDRLHCHILCVLLGIPHSVIDNSYSKLTSFIDTWTKESSLLRVAASLEDAIEQWSSLHP